MKRKTYTVMAIGSFMLLMSCGSNTGDNKSAASSNEESPAPTGQSGVKDETSQKNIVGVAVGSKDHTTLVTAVKAADLVDALSNAGPFTVFAPTNAAHLFTDAINLLQSIPIGKMGAILVYQYAIVV